MENKQINEEMRLNDLDQNSESIKLKLKKYFRGLKMAFLGKVKENNTYDNTIHCN